MMNACFIMMQVLLTSGPSTDGLWIGSIVFSHARKDGRMQFFAILLF